MLITAVRCLAVQAAVFLCLSLSAAGVQWAFTGGDDAVALLELIVLDMLGVWVWTFGWGLAAFARAEGLGFANDLRLVFDNESELSPVISRIEDGVSHRRALVATAPITLLGFILTLGYGVPLVGVGKWLVVFGITAIYYVAAFLLWSFASTTRAFHYLYSAVDRVGFRPAMNPLFLENVLTYLSITTVVGVLAIYTGFRGTVTANFDYEYEALRTLLVTPLVLFLPATLFYNFYPRYVLRRLVQHKVFATMTRLTQESNSRDLVLQLKELGLTNAQVLPFVDYKSLPSYVISILFVVSLAYHNDPAVKSFFGYLLGLETD